MGTSVARTSNVTELYKIGEAYDMPSFPVDGMNVEAVHEAVAEAAARARRGDGRGERCTDQHLAVAAHR